MHRALWGVGCLILVAGLAAAEAPRALPDLGEPAAAWPQAGPLRVPGTVDRIAQKNLSSAFNYFDVNATFRFLENSDVIVGINNITDEEPPLLGSTVGNALGNANTVAGFYDTLGMFGFVNVTFRF